MATTTRKQGSGSPGKVEAFSHGPKAEWTDQERAAVIARARVIQGREHLHVRELIERAMRAALPEGRWRQDVRKWAFSRLQWFLDGISETRKEATVQATALRPRIEWTEEERAELIAVGREIRREKPGLSVRRTLGLAQREALPEDRQRAHVHSIPPDKLKWYEDALRGTSTEEALAPMGEDEEEGGLVELPPVGRSEELEELPQRALGKGVTRGTKVVWTFEEMEAILARAREIRDRTGLLNSRDLIERAQQVALPPERRRKRSAFGGKSIQTLIARMAQWPRFSVEFPAKADPARSEALRSSLASYAYPPPPPPEPIDVDAVVAEAVDEAVKETEALGIAVASTEDIVAELARRAFVGLRGGGNLLSRGLAVLQSFQDSPARRDHDHDLLMALVSELDPKLLAAPPAPPEPPPPVASNGVAATRVPPGGDTPPKAMPRIRGVLIGGAVDFGREVCEAVKSVIDLDHNPNSNNARNKGFKDYDVCFVTPIAGHSATKVAKNEIGHENVLFIPQTSASRIAEEIRKFVSKREAKYRRVAAVASNN